MRPKKSLGQHFLIAPSYAKKIADFVPSGKDGCVLEIGPGRGALSVFLKELFPSFHLVEIDGEVIPELKAKLGAGGWTLHECNALGFDFLKAGFPLHVVGNLPYSCAAMIIRKTLLYGEAVASCTFMVQREVAERIIAGAHCKQYGFLSIFCRFFGKYCFMCLREFFSQNPESILRFSRLSDMMNLQHFSPPSHGKIFSGLWI
jgi:16S rRNA (adenine1518-N6/adenine1519-N6)-dimethyltransferase